MTANMYAWEPTMRLDPRAANFLARVEALSDPKRPVPPTPAMRQFVGALLAKYPELSDDDTVDTIWGDGPLIGDANGGFINLSIVWPRYEVGRAFFLKTAAELNLDAYDPQEYRYFPAKAKKVSSLGAASLGLAATNASIDRRTAMIGGLGAVLSRWTT